MDEEKTKADPVKIFNSIAEILTNRGHIKVTLKSIKMVDGKEERIIYESNQTEKN